MSLRLIICLRVLVTVAISFFIGLERERSHKDAGLRTIMLIAVGTTFLTTMPFLLVGLSKSMDFMFDFSRIISYIIVGIGFLAGIVIVKGDNHVEGITTSAAIWSTVAVSMLIGMGEYLLGIFGALLIIVILKSKPYLAKLKEDR
jgi:putative Mg2+ transporter-C (MgtC) family protein